MQLSLWTQQAKKNNENDIALDELHSLKDTINFP